MDSEKIKKIEKSIENLKNKTAKIYFLVQDTKGNPKASVKYIYDMALTLKNKNFNVVIIHETKEYQGVSSWLNEDYSSLPHQEIEGQNLAISPEDFVVIPELYGHVMEQLAKFPCGKIVLCQSYDYILETLAPGVSWTQYGFFKCITTSEEQKKYLSTIMKNVSYDVVQPIIDSVFTKKEKPSKPIISIHTRDTRDTSKIIKTFYLKYPQFRWITFRDMRGIAQEDFSKFLKDSFVSVWVDNESSFGTYPLESMVSGTPVIGKVPNMIPEWMTEDNGIWTQNFNEIVDIIANFIQNWLEDNISEKLYDGMTNTISKYTNKEFYTEEVINLFNEYYQKREESLSQQLEKINETEKIN
jgi:hypothetical protein